jgi:hypothetical protein
VDALTNKELKLEEIDSRKLPAEMQTLTRDEVAERINKAREERMELQKEIEQVSKDRAEYIAKERSAASGKGDSFDKTVAQAIRKEAGTKGLTY